MCLKQDCFIQRPPALTAVHTRVHYWEKKYICNHSAITTEAGLMHKEEVGQI